MASILLLFCTTPNINACPIHRRSVFQIVDFALQQELADTCCSDDEPPDQEDIADYKAALKSMEKEQTMLGDCIMCYACGKDK